MNKFILSTLVIVSLSGCMDDETKWLYEGNPDGLNRQEWSQAYPDLKLGTAGRWLQALDEKGFIKDKAIVRGPEFKQNAQKLSDCLDSSIKVSQAETNNLVASCVQTMGWASNS